MYLTCACDLHDTFIATPWFSAKDDFNKLMEAANNLLQVSTFSIGCGGAKGRERKIIDYYPRKGDTFS